MAAIDASIYEEITVESFDGNRSVDLRLGVISVDYYEDVFSQTITAKIVVSSTGYSTVDDKLQGLYSGLPFRGGERVSIKILGNSESNKGLDFSTKDDYLYVSSITNVITEAQREAFTLHLVSREALNNEVSRVYESYSSGTRIDTAVEKIIKDKLDTKKPVEIDPVSNKYGFIGNMRKPYTVLTWLASKAVSEDGKSAGFFFYQTQDGLKFKSIDKLISQKPFEKKYQYSEVNEAPISKNNDFKILRYAIDRNQDLTKKLRYGAYSSKLSTFNPLDGTFATGTIGPSQNTMKNLGQEQDLPDIRAKGNQRIVDIASRNMTQIIDVGTLDVGIGTETNANPFENIRQSIIRYNLLLSQTMTMTVPLNTNLKAGDLINCEFPKLSVKDKELDPDKSGLYMIKELCHHFDGTQSLTSMKLVRDTFGVYGTNNK